MAFGTAVGSVEKLKKQLEARKAMGSGPRRIPKDESIVVRFLTEPDEWVSYREAYSQDLKRYYPVPEGVDTGPEIRVSNRYLANALDTGTDKVIPLVLPVTLVNRLLTRYERHGTLMDRDYEMMRIGSGLDTEYDVESHSPEKRKLSGYELLDLEEILSDQYEMVFGGDDEDDKPKHPLQKRRGRKLKSESPKFPDEKELKRLSLGELRSLARENDIDTDGMKKADLVEALLDHFEEERF